jgi:hypothetical protein
VSAGGARRGRRDNGLDAADFAVAGDVDPRVGEHLLDVLAAGGIAAYLQPSADLNPITRTTTFPARPTDRLYVDRTHLAVARDYLTRLAEEPDTAGRPGTPASRPGGAPGAPSGNPPDVDAAWARIVAGFHLDADPTAPPWPSAENLDPTRENPDPTRERPDPTREPGPPAGAGAPPGVRADGPPEARAETDPGSGTARRLPSAADISGISVGRRPDEPSLLDGLDTFGAGLPDDASDERYTPPPPPPLPRISKYAVVGVLGIVAGFALFLFPTLLPLDHDVTTLIGFTAIVAGFVTLVCRLRSGDEDDDFDDGAVV